MILHGNILCWLRPSFGYRFVTSFALEANLSATDTAPRTLCQIKCYRILILPISFQLAQAKSELDRFRSFVANRVIVGVPLHKKLVLKSNNNKIYNGERLSLENIDITFMYSLVTLVQNN